MSNLYVDQVYTNTVYTDQIANKNGIKEITVDKINYTISYNFSGTISFSTCGRTGALGPVLSNALSSYTTQPFFSIWGINLNLFNVIAGVQYWRVPRDGVYTIRCAGARSGPSTFGGLGIDLTTSYTLFSGESLKIVCGQRGEGNNSNFGAGGGASFVAVSRFGAWIPILVSGGGGGISSNSPASTNVNRNAFDPVIRSNETRGGFGTWYNTSYGSQVSHYWNGGGGGGWSQPGGDGQMNFYSSGQPLGGRALNSDSPMGGIYTHDTSNTYDGGFGGGGATGYNGGAAGGGGGWWGGNATYSLLGATSDDTNFLGGGSYSANNYIVNGLNNTEGFVFITL